MPNLGIALSGGAAKGLAHIYIMKKLLFMGMPVKMIAGASSGAMIGSMFALGMSSVEIERVLSDFFKTLSIPKMVSYLNWAYFIPFYKNKCSGLFDLKKFELYLDDVFNNANIEDCKIPFVCTTTDMLTGETIYLKTGNLAKAICCSIAFPLMFKPISGRYADGGIRENCPVNVLKRNGCDKIIAVDLKKDFGTSLFFRRTYLGTFIRLIDVLHKGEINEDIRDADLVIKPILTDLKFFDFDEFAMAEDAAMKALEEHIQTIKSW